MAQRQDAARNRDRLLAAALDALTATSGVMSLEAVARAAGVGIGTLYRHFPTREALVEAVYATELAKVCDRAAPLAARGRCDLALREWLGVYADFVATKRGMAEAVRELVSSGAVSSAGTRERLASAVAVILEAGVRSGELRADVPAEDVVAAMAAAVLSGTDRAQVERLLDLLVAGVRSQRQSRSAG